MTNKLLFCICLTLVAGITHGQTPRIDPEAYVIDFCPDARNPSQLPYGRSGWAFLRKGEKTRMMVLHVNPLRYSVGIDAAAVAFNTDPAAVSGPVGTVFKPAFANGKLAFDAELQNLVDLSFQLSAKRTALQKLDCLTDTDISKLTTFLETEVKVKLKNYPNEARLDGQLKLLAANVEEMAKKEKDPGIKAALNALAAYGKQDNLAKDMFALIDQLDQVPDATTLKTTWINVDDYPNADVLRFTRTTKNLLDSASPTITQYYNVWLVGRAKLDFSAGLVMTGLADKTMAFADTVVVIDGKNAIRQRPITERQDKVTLALATLGHLYWRTTWWQGRLNPGLSLGAGVTTQGKPVYLAGASLMLGRQQRLVLSGGVAVGTQKELSARYDQPANYYLSDPADFTYVDRTRARWFAGLTFNFGKNEKAETIIGTADK